VKPHAPLFAVLALIQLASPAPAAATLIVPLCGENGGSAPLHIPMKRDNNLPCCGKLCHVNDRKRSSGQCCGPEEDSDDA